MIQIDLDKVDSKFRLLTDLLLFSDRNDLSLSDFKKLLKSNYNMHYSYFWDRFIKASEISWDPEFWNTRLNFLFSVNNKSLSKSIERHIEKKFFELIKFKHNLKIENRVEYIHFLELCKVKNNRKVSLHKIKKKFIELPLCIRYSRLSNIIKLLVPNLFSSFDEYILLLCKESKLYNDHMRFVIFANQNKIIDNKSFVADLFFDLIKLNNKLLKLTAKRSAFQILKDNDIREIVKQRYTNDVRSSLVKILGQMTFNQLDEHFFANIKNTLNLDSSLVDELLNIYANQLYSKDTVHKRAKVDRLSKLIKFVPEITSKKVLTWLSVNNKSSDMKYFLSIFPDLKRIAAFA